jgi:hypothetical protein
MIFGSWFGDWDSQDNIMRAVLATATYGLVCCWSGSPHWFCQHMALGETIGFSTRLTQNNTADGLYQTETNTYANQVHIALMGDPTLRMHPVAPPANLTGAVQGSGVQLNWNASSDPAVLGYYVYRAANPGGPFARLTTSLVTGGGYADSTAPAGTNTYMVRAVKLESTPSGTYTNASQGIFVTVAASGSGGRVGVTVRSIALAPAGIVLTWDAMSGEVYGVAGNSNLATTNWTDLETNLNANGTSLSWTDVTARATSRKFYEVFRVP